MGGPLPAEGGHRRPGAGPAVGVVVGRPLLAHARAREARPAPQRLFVGRYLPSASAHDDGHGQPVRARVGGPFLALGSRPRQHVYASTSASTERPWQGGRPISCAAAESAHALWRAVCTRRRRGQAKPGNLLADAAWRLWPREWPPTSGRLLIWFCVQLCVRCTFLYSVCLRHVIE